MVKTTKKLLRISKCKAKSTSKSRFTGNFNDLFTALLVEFPDGTVKKMPITSPEIKVMLLNGGDFAFTYKFSGLFKGGVLSPFPSKPVESTPEAPIV